jgi:hypothetical protein
MPSDPREGALGAVSLSCDSKGAEDTIRANDLAIVGNPLEKHVAASYPQDLERFGEDVWVYYESENGDDPHFD